MGKVRLDHSLPLIPSSVFPQSNPRLSRPGHYPLMTPPQLTPTSPCPCQLLTPMTTESLAVAELQKANCCMMQTFLWGSDDRPQKALNVTYLWVHSRMGVFWKESVSSSFTMHLFPREASKTAVPKSSPPATSIFLPPRRSAAFCRPGMVPMRACQ